MLLDKAHSCLLLVDVQEKLTPHVVKSDELVARCHWLLRLAHEVQVPVLTSEQYPQGLGGTVSPLKECVANQVCTSKVHFSSYCDSAFVEHWQATKRSQAVICGIETHVCVLQTAMKMKEAGIDVFVVADAVSSRHELDHEYGLKRMRAQGIQILTAEMVFFEWVRKAGTPEFKALSQAFLR
ncbi:MULTISPECIES: hydrolase [Legionella]|uniref:Hydrolase n=1 Tax=Legionella septentrionalis TaxID=2498109 RepID=A0A3S0XGH4_9GAMM|nr:hydrolase [Legionella septentrionalis]MCP0913334.1 hydrolase [Legionella sp. 27cVA30]RUQ88378.1 hydrolase [Legionella septentrionalis]RUQ93518.1 hydrolase [Legionella septentrionalis]RUR09484.1 hydrolase [Legionella septentrionalis]RUR13249.1 hydrolase [Legionella septentrionalis]